jgi:signal transduction histidine kinase
VEYKLETLDLAKIHDAALQKLVPTDSSNEQRDQLSGRAAIFFTEAIIPIEATHRAAREDSIRLDKLNDELGRCATDLAASNRDLQQGISDRKSAEAALRSVAEHPAKVLEESRLIEEQLHDKTRGILYANEEERRRMSIRLQDEIAQTLLGIHVRLLALKKEATSNRAGFSEELAATQKLVDESLKSLDKFSSEFGIDHES